MSSGTGSPKEGDAFIIVEYSLHSRSDGLTVRYTEDMLLIDSIGRPVTGYSTFSAGKDYWAAGGKSTFEKGEKRNNKMLFIAPTNRIRGAKILFLNEYYPLDGFLQYK